MMLLIDNYDSFTYNLYQIVSQLEEEVVVSRNDKISIAEIKELSPDGIILSPGPGRPEEAGLCLEVIRCYSGHIPILGVCLGHQAIALAFGAKIAKANKIFHGKSSFIFHNRHDLYDGMSLPFQAGRYHSLIVERQSLPAELKIEAETRDEVVMGIKHHEHPTYGVQFHPESILSEGGINLIKNFIAICKQKEGV